MRIPDILYSGVVFLMVLAAACQPLKPAATPSAVPPTQASFPIGTTSSDFSDVQDTPTLPPIPTAIAAVETPTAAPARVARKPSGELPLPGIQVAALAFDDRYFYWVSQAEPRKINRTAVGTAAPGKNPEVIATSKFVTGTLAAMPIQLRGGWLVFLDIAINANNPVWKLRAVNLQSKQERLLDAAGGDRLARIHGFSTDGLRAAWIVQDSNPKRSCVEESAVLYADLASGKAGEIGRSCVGKDRQWNALQVSGDNILASATSANLENQAEILLVSLNDSTIISLAGGYPNEMASYPAIAGDLAAWQAGSAGARLYWISSKRSALIPPQNADQTLVGPSLAGQWLTWVPDPVLAAYQVNTRTWVLLAAPVAGEKITATATAPGRIAWAVESTAENGDASSRIEWTDLD